MALFVIEAVVQTEHARLRSCVHAGLKLIVPEYIVSVGADNCLEYLSRTP